jgi:hypothetical protein
MLIPAPLDCYDAPEGTFRAVCVDVFEFEKNSAQGPEKFLRLTWELQDSPDPEVRYLVAKNYSANRLAGLRKDLHTWLGHTGDIDTSTLKGTDATVTVAHIHNPAYEKPFCWVSKVGPPAKED